MDMVTSPDGRYIAVSSLRDIASSDTGWDYHILDTQTGDTQPLTGVAARSMIGFFGGRLAAYAPGAGESSTPIVLIDIATGETTSTGGPGGTFAGTFSDGEDSWLVRDGPTVEGKYGLWTMKLGEQEWTPLYNRAQDFTLETSRMVRPTQWSNVESDGWIAVLPEGVAYLPPGTPERDSDRSLVSLTDGTIVTLGPTEEAK